MPATLSSSGTWTALSMDITPFRMGAQSTTAANTASLNTPQVANLAVGDFASAGKLNIPTEVIEMIELIMSGYGSNPGNPNNARVAFWPAAALLRAWLNALFSGETSTVPFNQTANISTS